MKNTYHIKDARVLSGLNESFFGRKLSGINVDNPNCTIGGTIITSPIISVDEETSTFETLNSIYVVDSYLSNE